MACISEKINLARGQKIEALNIDYYLNVCRLGTRNELFIHTKRIQNRFDKNRRDALDLVLYQIFLLRKKYQHINQTEKNLEKLMAVGKDDDIVSILNVLVDHQDEKTIYLFMNYLGISKFIQYLKVVLLNAAALGSSKIYQFFLEKIFDLIGNTKYKATFTQTLRDSFILAIQARNIDVISYLLGIMKYPVDATENVVEFQIINVKFVKMESSPFCFSNPSKFYELEVNWLKERIPTRTPVFFIKEFLDEMKRNLESDKYSKIFENIGKNNYLKLNYKLQIIFFILLIKIMACKICNEFYKEKINYPVILNCGHTICFACFEKIPIKKLETTLLQQKCPICQTVVKHHTKNLAILEFIEKTGKIFKESDELKLSNEKLTIEKETLEKRFKIDLEKKINELFDDLDKFPSFFEKISFTFDKILNTEFVNSKIYFLKLSKNYKLEYGDILSVMLKYEVYNEISKKILDKGINSVNSNNWSNLMLACFYGNLEIVEYLLNRGVDVNYQSLDGYTALMIASEQSNESSSIEVIIKLIENGAYVNFKNEKLGLNAFMLACINFNTTSSIDTVKLLLKNKAYINDENNQGLTALSLVLNKSVNDSHYEIVKYLIDNNTDVNNKDKNGLTPLALLLEKENFNDTNSAALLIEKSDINAQDYNGESILIKTIKNRRNNEFLQIIGMDVELDKQDKNGKTALMYLLDKYRLKDAPMENIMKMLEKDQNLDLRDDKGYTAFMYQVLYSFELRNIGILKLLYSKGLNIHLTNKDGKNALLLAIDEYMNRGNSFKEIIDYLKDLEQKLNIEKNKIASEN